MTAKAGVPRFLMRIQDKVRDYRASGSVMVVALGDSVTMGVTAPDTLEPSAVYHARLKGMLEVRFPAAVFSFINSGIGGERAVQGLARLDRDVLRYSPDLVLVAFGLNDVMYPSTTPAAFGDTIRQIVQRVRRETPADVILLTPPFMATRETLRVDAAHRGMMPGVLRAQNEGRLNEFADAIRNVGDSENVAVADVYAAWEALARSGVDTTAMLANGINHPTGESHTIAAECVMDVITEGLEQ